MIYYKESLKVVKNVFGKLANLMQDLVQQTKKNTKLHCVKKGGNQISIFLRSFFFSILQRFCGKTKEGN